jgi:hypothetical protein
MTDAQLRGRIHTERDRPVEQAHGQSVFRNTGRAGSPTRNFS